MRREGMWWKLPARFCVNKKNRLNQAKKFQTGSDTWNSRKLFPRTNSSHVIKQDWDIGPFLLKEDFNISQNTPTLHKFDWLRGGWQVPHEPRSIDKQSAGIFAVHHVNYAAVKLSQIKHDCIFFSSPVEMKQKKKSDS